MRNFTALDFFVLFVYLAGTTALGLWLGRAQRARSSESARAEGAIA